MSKSQTKHNVQLAQTNIKQEKDKIVRKAAYAEIRVLEQRKKELIHKFRFINSQGESTLLVEQQIKQVDNDITTERLKIDAGSAYNDFREDLVFEENRKKFKVMFYD